MRRNYHGSRCEESTTGNTGDNTIHNNQDTREQNEQERERSQARGHSRTGVHSRLGHRPGDTQDGGPRGSGRNGRKFSQRNKQVQPLDVGGDQTEGTQPTWMRKRTDLRDLLRARYEDRNKSGKPTVSLDNVCGWYKVILRNGSIYDNKVLLTELQATCGSHFLPFCCSQHGKDLHFYLEDSRVFGPLTLNLDKKLVMKDGSIPRIYVERSNSPPPNIPLMDENEEKIKMVLSKRYNPGNKALNLKSFHSDKDFAGECYYTPLWISDVVNRIFSVIVDNIPDLYALDLSNNKLTSKSLKFFQTFKIHLNNLQIIYLANNYIEDSHNFETMEGMKLVELKLVGNPLVKKMGSSYVQNIRKIFPHLQKLDDRDLPREICFEEDDDETTSYSLPPCIQKFCKHPEAESCVLMFLKEYIKYYDCESRQPLLSAYHEDAVMSLSAFGRQDVLSAYIPESRNLKILQNNKKRNERLRRGNLQIVAFLSKLPKTEHDMTTFTLDLPFCCAGLINFTVTGIFRERETKLKEFLYFNRCFILVPNGNGFNIINETMYVSTVGDINTSKAFMMNPSGTLEPSADRQTLTRAFSQQSGMNLEWSAKCLQENCWDLGKSTAAYTEAQKLNRIPAIAFLK